MWIRKGVHVSIVLDLREGFWGQCDDVCCQTSKKLLGNLCDYQLSCKCVIYTIIALTADMELQKKCTIAMNNVMMDTIAVRAQTQNSRRIAVWDTQNQQCF